MHIFKVGGKMKYEKYIIKNYRAIRGPLVINLSARLVPLVGVNECGKTTILQAIFCFDHNNDQENEGRHLSSLDNLYETTSMGVPTVSAIISCKRTNITGVVDAQITALNKKLTETPQNTTAPAVSAPALNVEQQQQYNERINRLENLKKAITELEAVELTRNLKTKKYSCGLFSSLKEIDNNALCENLISKMPYTLYNDDFNDRPVDKINLSTKNDDWYDIYNRVFVATNAGYSLEKLTIESELRRESIIKDVESYLGNVLTKAWTKFTPERKKIAIELKYKESTTTVVGKEPTALNELYVRVVETQSGKTGRFFSITDRSKGFIWYYNFIMKIMFNPKQSGTPKETIFLLDEPGSYLHEVAQSALCEKLSSISKKEGIVIYCTHSPQLLNPRFVSLNATLIIDKTKKQLITATPISSKNLLHSRKNTAMQPIYDALMIPEYEQIHANEKMLCVEGIYDKYCIECFCDLSSDIRLFPSVNAESIVLNIQYFVAYRKEYLALWDNDDEGRKCYDKAKNSYGDVEASRFSVLPNVTQRKDTKMENMIAKADYQYLSNSLGLNGSIKYKTIMHTLYFMDYAERKKIVDGVSNETKNNFVQLNVLINQKLLPNS